MNKTTAWSGAAGFREFIARLRQAGDIVEVSEPICLVYEIGALCRVLADEDGPAALLTSISGNRSPCQAAVVNLYGPRRRIALALGTDEHGLLQHVAKRIRERVPPVIVDRAKAPCQENVLLGDEVDLTKWPIPLWNEGDGGPYITAGLWIAPHPEFGFNIAHHRGQIYGPREIGVCVAPDHHLRLATDEARPSKTRVEAAIIIGARPSLTIAASSDFPHGDYEVSVAGALEGRPIEVVQCRTVDIAVPADTEIVVEGYFDGEQRSEGPFVEFTGYQTPVITSPVFKVTAITYRNSPIFHGVFAGVPPCETNTLWRELEEAEAYSVLRRKFPMLKAVHRPPQVGRDFWGVLQIDPSRYREGMTTTLLLASAAVMPRLKYVVAVDDDIDLYNLTEVVWAICTRCDPKADVQLVEGTMTSWLDPSSGGVTGKLLIDATKKKGFRGEMPGFPASALARAKSLIAGAKRN
jgi:4-hydroxy-3-polyprenylbenzoate decarboxylase/2,5-furandicarboxylate decarboxylase 1